MVSEFDKKSTKTADVSAHEDKLKNNTYVLPEKQFELRESLVTILFENPHVKTIHHIAIAFFAGLFVTTVCQDYVEHHEFNIGVRLILKGFGKLHIALAGWIAYYCCTIVTYFCFKIWAEGRITFGITEISSRKRWDSSAILILLSYYVFSFRLAVHIVRSFELPPASAAIVLIEQTRLLMKVHAFVRSNISKVLNYKEKADQKLNLPTLQYFVYFTAVPTLVFRDEYPRSPNIRWRKVLSYASESLAIIFFYSFAMDKYFIPAYKDFGIRIFTYNEILLKMLETSFAALLFFLITFYLVLHLVQNLFAEILQFGDRMFYKDWWTATDFTTYYKKWNVLVHDWLYTYIYKDCYEILLPKNKMFAKYATFLISAIVHEWIMMHMLGYFFPLLFCVFFFLGTLVTHMNPPENAIINILFWMSISYGMSFLMCGYILEFYARYNNVQPLREDIDFYIPRSLTCDCYA